MRNLLLLFLLCYIQSLFAQQLSSDQSSTYALVVGISDYQDEGIPDLRFAAKDAEAFAAFLQSPTGGSLDEDHLKVLTNEKATVAQFAIALDWLMEVAKENDRVLIYFSGHGDVERKTITQPGYFLCWDAPSRVYMAGGALALPIFQDVVSTLSVQNKAKVIVVSDACRSGKLSGSSVGGTQLTSSNLAKQYANEIKILSCQPNEYSIEGEQWGGGRGAFSYYLLDGLTGMADGNADLSVDLKEIGRYLEDYVTEEVAPQSQNPMVIGNKTEKLTDVFPEILAQLKEGKRGQLQLFTSTESRGIEDEVLAASDSNVVEMYMAFQKAIDEKQFLEPATACADFYYEKLSQEPQLEKLHSAMRRNYAAALQDDAQQVLNTMLKSGLTEQVLRYAKREDVYRTYPAYLDRAAELLGKNHYMYPILQARKHFFEGQILSKKIDKRIAFHKALSQQSEMPHALVELIRNSEAEQQDSAEYFFQKATTQIPSWIEPYIALSDFYNFTKKNYERGEELLHLAWKLDSTSILVWYRKALCYQIQKKYELAESWYLKTINGTGQNICFPCTYLNLGILYRDNGRFSEAEPVLKKAIHLDPEQAKSYLALGDLYLKTKRYTEAEQQFKKAIQLDSNLLYPYINLANLYKKTQRFPEAEKQYKKVIQIKPTFTNAYNHLGYIYLEARQYIKAEAMYKKSVELDTTQWTPFSNLGLLYHYLQRWEEAAIMTQKAIDLMPNDGGLVAELGHALTHIPERQAEAGPIFRKAQKMDPDWPDTYLYLAVFQMKTGLPDKAWQNIEIAFEKGLGKNGRFYQQDLQVKTELEPFRQEVQWKELMEKYFPGESKD